ncbi:MAG: glycosyltransferase [Pirellulaceae bacterium]|nr:glycosyltransferase [Pirellulaceae bacterium]
MTAPAKLSPPTVPGNRRPRSLYFIVKYPNFSETYMHEEIRSLREQYDIRVITYKRSEQPRAEAFPYEVIEYTDPCLVYSQIGNVNQMFSAPSQVKFLAKVGAIIREFQPDVLHCHYLGLSLLLRKLAETHQVPFTIRTHSMDVLSEPPEKLRAMCDAANSRWCLRVLAFPTSCARLVGAGLLADKVVSCWPVLNFARFHQPAPRAATRQVMCAGPAIPKKAHHQFVDLAKKMRGQGFTFNLYAKGPTLEKTREYNQRAGSPVHITYADPDEMPSVYPRHDWLVYPSDCKINKVGLPVAICEAQASGLGVCWQELPGRRAEQLDFLAGGGFLFQDLRDVPALLLRPYPEEMRQRGFAAAARCDIERHKHLLSDVWSPAPRRAAA